MTGSATLETRIVELLMNQLAPCDLGDGIEVVHEVESLEVEMECDLSDDAPVEALEDVGTHEFVRFSAPYERIELQLDAKAFLHATIEEAKAASALRARRE